MNPQDKEFENNMNQLVRLLKKLMKNLPGQPFSKLQGKPGDGAMHLNVCFFNFFPMGPEDYDAFEEAYEQSLSFEDREEHLSPQLSPSDIEFLRRHGIRF